MKKSFQQVFKLILWVAFLGLLNAGCASRYAAEQDALPTAPMAQPIAYNNAPFKPTAAPLVVIDAGHGGKDLGTHSEKGAKYQEKALTLATVKLLDQYLRQLGYRTVLTRRDDTFVSLDRRAELANEAKPRLFISVHYNSAASTSAEGIEVFFFQSDKDKGRTQQSKTLGNSIHDQVVAMTSAKSRGVKHGNYAVIRETEMPAILIEGGFLTNASEREKILSSSYIQKLAWGIAQGVDKYIKS